MTFLDALATVGLTYLGFFVGLGVAFIVILLTKDPDDHIL